jgi:hypothetical protein
MPAGAIHGVWNDTGRISASLHVHGMHMNHSERAQFDRAARTESPFKVKLTS